ncbi:unnamed protein product [Ceratitis capitata]|uniref:(Mediterranean fruit fly) hypothetical protein n=1 Tax=Ceratitis capitata TaxID=7213 RepID=A0A811UKH0_CERCA|nr:unnamed protein product [Ceratitis capitata]
MTSTAVDRQNTLGLNRQIHGWGTRMRTEWLVERVDCRRQFDLSFRRSSVLKDISSAARYNNNNGWISTLIAWDVEFALLSRPFEVLNLKRETATTAAQRANAKWRFDQMAYSFHDLRCVTFTVFDLSLSLSLGLLASEPRAEGDTHKTEPKF